MPGAEACRADAIPIRGCCWSLPDNFEWQKGFGINFGLIAVDRQNGQKRAPRRSRSPASAGSCKATLYPPEQKNSQTPGSGVYHYEYATDTNLEPHHYTMDTPVNVMLADLAAKAVLTAALPAVLDSSAAAFLRTGTFNDLKDIMPDGERLFAGIIKELNIIPYDGTV